MDSHPVSLLEDAHPLPGGAVSEILGEEKPGSVGGHPAPLPVSQEEGGLKWRLCKKGENLVHFPLDITPQMSLPWGEGGPPDGGPGEGVTKLTTTLRIGDVELG